MRPLLLFVAASLCGISANRSFSYLRSSDSEEVRRPATSGPGGSAKERGGSGAFVWRRPNSIFQTKRDPGKSSSRHAAYHLKAQQVIGPDWLTTERYGSRGEDL